MTLAWGNNVGDNGAIALSNSLKHNVVIKTLLLSNLIITLGDTKIGDKGALALADYLESAVSIEKLDLCNMSKELRFE